MVKYNLTSSQFNFYTKNTTLDGVLWSQGVLEVFPEVYSYEQLNNAYNRLILSNDSLRVKLVQNEDAVQTYVEDFQYVDFPFIQVETDEELMQAAEDFLNTPIDIYERLVRCTVFQTKNSSGVMICAHHLVVDGYSAVVMAEQINHYLKNPEYIPPAYQSFGEYLEKEESHRKSKRFERDRKFWSEQFASAPVCDFVSAGKSSMDFSCKHTNIEIPSELFAEINFFCKKYDITPSTFFNTVYSVYLSRKYDLTNFSIGVPVLNRTTQGEMNMVGLYMHIVPLIINLQNESFVFNAQRIQDSVMSLFRHQKFTQQDIKDLLKEEKRSGNILFEIVSDYLELPHNDDYEIRIPYSNTLSVPMEMHLQNINNNEYLLKIRYRTAFFSENEVSSMLASIMKIAEEALKKPDECVFKLEMLPDEEREKLLNTFNNTAFDYGITNDTTLYSLFEKTAKKNPEKVCLTTAEGELTFGELLTIAESLDREIQKTTKGKKSVIPVIAQRSPEMYAAIYGIIRGGNAYLPIADDYPQDRIDYILENSGAPLAVTQGKYTSLVKNISCINMTQFIENYEKTENILSSAAKEDDTAYVIYTSGSTGNPKGARVSHKSAVNRILWMHEMYPLTENDVILQKTPYTFDVSVWELFWWGMVGGKLAASKPLEHFLPAKILDEVYKNKVTHLHFVPSVFELFLNYLEANKEEVHKFSSVRYVFLSGEALSAELITRFYVLYDYNSVGLHNLYGPTECAVDVTYYPCKPTDTNPVPIGKPIYNTQIHIVDKYMNLLPVGVKGELCIGGVNVGQGYLNNEALTAEKFVNNPFGEGKLYKTGDLAYFREDGEVIFCGRIDSQIKLNGQRIELGEIENAMSAIDAIIMSAVVVRKDKQDRQFICAFYTGEEISHKKLREQLGKTLPKYMVPHIFTHLEEMPMTSSGKISRKALPEIEFMDVSEETEFVHPETQEEKALAKVVCSVLRITDINMLDNFFNVGGDSISAIYIVSELEKLSYRLQVAELMQSDTFADAAKTMEEVSAKVIYEQDEVNGFVEFTPIMRAFLKESNSMPTDFEHKCIVACDCDEKTARKAIDALVRHHDILRAVICENGLEIYPYSDREVYSFDAVCADNAAAAKEILNAAVSDKNKLINVVFCNAGTEKFISICIHHFIVDLLSWEVLISDFFTLVEQLNKDEESSLPAKTASFKLWSEELYRYSAAISEDSKKYWENINKQLDNAKTFCRDNEKENEAEFFSFSLDADISDKLINKANRTYSTKTNELLLTALGLAAGEIAGGSVGIMVESHGREKLHDLISVEHTVGWFTSCYPVITEKNISITDALIKTKETMRRIPRSGIDYLLLSQGFHVNTDIIFNFYKNSITEEQQKKLIAFNADNSVFPGKINVSCFFADNILNVDISVPKSKHKQQITKELGIEFRKQIEKLIDACVSEEKIIKTGSDFTDDELTKSELDELKTLFGEDNAEDICRLTPSQKGIYAQYFQKTDTKTYHLQSLCRIDKNSDTDMLGRCVELLSLRHPILRSAFAVLKSTGAIKQIILKNRKPQFSIIEQKEPFSQAVLDNIIAEDAGKDIDLQKDTLFGITLIDFSDARFILVHTHHIILDGWCFPIIINDLQKYYAALSNGVSEEGLSDEIKKELLSQTSYAEYSTWIRNQDTQYIYGYWQNLLSECSVAHIFDKEKKNKSKNEDIITFRTELGDELSQSIEHFAKVNKASNNTVFECAFAVALQKYSGSEDVVFDKVISGRSIPLKNIENTVGNFINTVPVRIKSTENSSFAELIKETQTQTINANKYGILPLSQVYRECNIDGKSIDALFVFENYYIGEMSDIESGPLSPKLISFNEQTEFNLTVTVLKEKNSYIIRTSYDGEMYTEREISDFINGYLCLLKVSLDADKRVKDISVADINLINSFNATAHSYSVPDGSTVYSLFEKTAKKNPEKVCLTTAEGELTFGELLTIAESLDREIQKTTKGKKSVIPVIAQRSPEMYAAIYGIIRGGNAYLPIADDYPQERIDYILENSSAPVAVTQGKFTPLVKNIPCIDMTRFIEKHEKTDNILPSCAKAEDTAYVIYTSGSTGNPKGAQVSHKSAVNRILWMHEMYPLGENDVILQKTPYTFDVSVWELFWWGMVGGRLAASKPQEHFLPARILDEVYRNNVTHLHFVPSVFELFLNYLEANKEEVQKFSSVRYVFLSGEALSAELVKRFYALFDYTKVGLHNLYGPTECAVDVTYYPCKPTDTNPVPIGKPIYNTQIHIVDKYMNLLPVGVKGELCIGGVNVGQGYLNNDELTAEKFVNNPFGEGKLYKTGDLAYFREDGEVIFCGRIDSQIKLNGQRIETDEIEAVISSISQVEAAAVVVNKLRSPEMLVAFYCSVKDITEEIRELCLRKLPSYMVPAAFVRLDKMPLNQSGKLDRKLLSQRRIDFTVVQADDTPKTETEKRICDLFKKALNTDNIGRNSNFFENGGTSISMISVLSEKLFENITAAQFIQNATPVKLAEIVDGEKKVSYEYLEPLYISPEASEAFVLLPFAGGSAEVYSAFTDALKKQNDKISVYFIRYLHTVNDCEKAADEISALMERASLSIYSHCVGSALALNILSSLEKKGKTVKHYFAGASIPPVKPSGKNIWNIVPDFVLKRILVSAGSRLNTLSAENQSFMLQSFRKDTDFANIAFADFNGRIKTPVSIILSKDDIFTKNYKKAKQIWESYAENVSGVYFIRSDSHYFQSADSCELVEILLKNSE